MDGWWQDEGRQRVKILALLEVDEKMAGKDASDYVERALGQMEGSRIRLVDHRRADDAEAEMFMASDYLERAYRIQQRNYRKWDAQNALDELFPYERPKPDEVAGALFGPPEGDLIEAIVDRFEKDFDCNVPENDMWRNACNNVLKELEG